MDTNSAATCERATTDQDISYKNLYLSAMNDLKDISDSAIAAQRRLEEMFLSQADLSSSES